MKKRVYLWILIEVVTLLALTVAWEFLFEDPVFTLLKLPHKAEDLPERLEYIITSMIFILIALIFPLRWLFKDIAKREQVISELQTALDNIQTLRGLLPICASCKKIRDDDGYWHQVEVYIRDHSEAEFSHSICPLCTKKLYPDIY